MTHLPVDMKYHGGSGEERVSRLLYATAKIHRESHTMAAWLIPGKLVRTKSRRSLAG